MSIRREESHLGRLLERVLLAALAVPCGAIGAVAACSSAPATPPETPDGGTAGAGGGADLDATADAATEEDQARCAPRVVAIDAGDDAGNCSHFLEFPCGRPAGAVETSDCYLSYNDCQVVCQGPLVFNCHSFGDSCADGGMADATPYVLECIICPNTVGRRPPGLVAPRARGAHSAVGAYLASAAHLEAASVHAFRILGRDLRDHGAPRSLTDAAGRAARDEARHARMMTRLAARHGARPPRAVVRRGPKRSLEEVAIENAVEGCVGETFGALVAAWQIRRAGDPSVAAVMTEIARDELRHAALAWAVARWAANALPSSARNRVRKAMRAAARALRCEVGEPDPALACVLGLPRAHERRALARLLEREIAQPASGIEREAGRCAR